MADNRLLRYLIDNPGWHYGLDLVAKRLASRSNIYVKLQEHVRMGFIECADEPMPLGRPGLPRHRFRTLLKYTYTNKPGADHG